MIKSPTVIVVAFLAFVLFVALKQDSQEETVPHYLWPTLAPETLDLLLFLSSAEHLQELTEDQERNLESLYTAWVESVSYVQPSTAAITGVSNPLEILDIHKRGVDKRGTSKGGGRYDKLLHELGSYPETVSFLANNRSILRVATLGEELGVYGQIVSQRLSDEVDMIQSAEAAYFDLFNYAPKLNHKYNGLYFLNPASIHPIPAMHLKTMQEQTFAIARNTSDEAEVKRLIDSQFQETLRIITQFYSSLNDAWYWKTVSFEVVQALGGGEYEVEIMGQRCILLANSVEFTTIGKAALPILFLGNRREGRTNRGFSRMYPELVEVSPEEFWDRVTEVKQHLSLIGESDLMVRELNERISAFNADFAGLRMDFR
jgi:hypothetical protein